MPFGIFLGEAEGTLLQITHKLEAAGLRVQKSFDLRSACASLTNNTCPHHGTSPCDCQLIVLLVYGAGSRPISLILHSHRRQSELHWDPDPANLPDLESRTLIEQVLNRDKQAAADIDQEYDAGVD